MEISVDIEIKPFGSSMILHDSVSTGHKFIFNFNKDLFTDTSKIGSNTISFPKLKSLVESFYNGYKLSGFQFKPVDIEGIIYSIPSVFYIQPIDMGETRKIETIKATKFI
jgi:hypothetical protein